MGAVLKWPLDLNDEVQEIGAGDVSLVDSQNGVLTVWTHEMYLDPVKKRSVRVVGTGHPTPYNADILGGAQVGMGLVFHVIDLTHCAPEGGGHGCA